MTHNVLNDAQRELAAAHVDLVERIARRRFGHDRRLLDDVIDAGYIGLCKAALAFDAARGGSFISYAWRRIEGEMLDRVRELRGRRRASGSYAKPAHMTALHPDALPIDALTSGEDSITWGDVASLEAHRHATERDEAQGVRALLDGLPARTQTVLEESYVHGRTLKEIADGLGVSESRACQIRSEGLERLRKQVGARVDRRSSVERVLAELAANTIRARDGKATARLARRVKAPESACRDLLLALEKSGMIVRERAARGSRVAEVRISDAGRARLRELEAAAA